MILYKWLSSCLFTKVLQVNPSYIHTSCTLNHEHKCMQKIMGASRKKKHRYSDRPILPVASKFSEGSYEGRRSGNSKRANVLNKLFMKYITDLMSTGNCSSIFVGYGIEINKVQVTPDYKCVNVFWVSKGNEKDAVIDTILQNNAGYLRSELANLNLVGLIPKIMFYKDKQYSMVLDVDKRLARADFGDDHVVMKSENKLKSQLQLTLILDDLIKKNIYKAEKEDDDFDIPIPTMPQNVLGLNHYSILEHIRKNMKKSQATHRLEVSNTDVIEVVQSVNTNPIKFANMKSQREAFKEFLIKRQIDNSKARREVREYDEDCSIDPNVSLPLNFDKFLEDDDYIEEK